MATVDYARLVAKAWVLYDQTGTPAILDDQNVASVTDDGVGLFTINWDANFANGNYACVGMTDDELVRDTNLMLRGSGSLQAAGTFALRSRGSNEIDSDRSRNSVVAFGSLA